MGFLSNARADAQKSADRLRKAEAEHFAAETRKEGIRSQIAQIDGFLENVGANDGADRIEAARTESLSYLKRDLGRGFPNSVVLHGWAAKAGAIERGYAELATLTKELATAKRAERAELEKQLAAELKKFPDLDAGESRELARLRREAGEAEARAYAQKATA